MRWKKQRQLEKDAESALGKSVEEIEQSAEELKKISERQREIAFRLRALQAEAEIIARK